MLKKALTFTAVLLFGAGLYMLPAAANSANSQPTLDGTLEANQLPIAKPATAVELQLPLEATDKPITIVTPTSESQLLDDEPSLDERIKRAVAAQGTDIAADKPIDAEAAAGLLKLSLVGDDRTLDELIKDNSLSPEHAELVQAKLAQDKAKRIESLDEANETEPASTITPETTETVTPTTPEVAETAIPEPLSPEFIQSVADELAEAVEQDPSLKGAFGGDRLASSTTNVTQALSITSELARVRANGSLRVALKLTCEPNSTVITNVLYSNADGSFTNVGTADSCTPQGVAEVEVVLQNADFNPSANSVNARIIQSLDGSTKGSISSQVALS